MSEERDRIREKKRKELMEKHGSDGEKQTPEATPAEPVEINSREQFEEITRTHDVVLVDCYADWCGPCQMMEPTVKALAAETDTAVAKVDVDAQPGLAQQLGAQGVPTFVVYADGKPVERVVGAQDRATLEQLLQQAR